LTGTRNENWRQSAGTLTFRARDDQAPVECGQTLGRSFLESELLPKHTLLEQFDRIIVRNSVESMIDALVLQ